MEGSERVEERRRERRGCLEEQLLAGSHCGGRELGIRWRQSWICADRSSSSSVCIEVLCSSGPRSCKSDRVLVSFVLLVLPVGPLSDVSVPESHRNDFVFLDLQERRNGEVSEVTYRVLAVLGALERRVAVETGELSAVAAVLVRIELLLGQDIAAGLRRLSVVSSGGQTRHSLSERGKDSAQSTYLAAKRNHVDGAGMGCWRVYNIFLSRLALDG